MTIQVWVCFDDKGEIEEIYLSPPEEKESFEYLAKLIPVNRAKSKASELKNISREVEISTKKTLKEISKLENSIKKFKIR